MRDIKFRAWAFDDEFMVDEEYNDDYFVFTIEGGEPKLLEAKFDQINQVISHYGECNHALMQYTGLKDKNGVEIYEGDIIQAWGWNMEIKFLVDCWFAESSSGECGEVGGEWDNHCEVIGNIYQNPELIK